MRKCMNPSCGRTYREVCKVHVWVLRNIGGILRPVRVIIKLCTRCMDPKESQKLVNQCGWKMGPRPRE